MAQGLNEFIDQLATYAPLDAEDRKAIFMLPTKQCRFIKEQYLAHQGDLGESILVLASGYALQQKYTGNGSRQISSLNLRGDILNLPSLFLTYFDADVVALMDSEVTSIPNDAFLSLLDKRPAISSAIFKITLVQTCIGREQLLNIGRRDARTRIANFLCTHAERMSSRGLVRNGAIFMPLTQQQIGDATGLTSVHVNRMLKSLIDEKLIFQNGRFFHILDHNKMIITGDYKPLKLYQEFSIQRKNRKIG